LRAHKHFRDASLWIAKAPPLIQAGSHTLAEAIVLRFPAERIQQGQHIGLAEGCKVLRPCRSQAWRWQHPCGGEYHAG